MAAESNARSLESSGNSNDRIELAGLEGFFEDDHEEIYSKGLSIKQAVFYYGDTRRSLKIKVEEGSIPAIRLPEAHGAKWRIFPDGVPPQLQDLIPKKLRHKAKQEKETAQPSEPETSEKSKAEAKAKPAGKKKRAQASPAQETTVEAAQILDFSVPGLDRPGELILRAAGFLDQAPLTNSHTDLGSSLQDILIEEPVFSFSSAYAYTGSALEAPTSLLLESTRLAGSISLPAAEESNESVAVLTAEPTLPVRGEAVPIIDTASSLPVTGEAVPVIDTSSSLPVKGDAVPIVDTSSSLSVTGDAVPIVDTSSSLSVTGDAVPIVDTAPFLSVTGQAVPIIATAYSLSVTGETVTVISAVPSPSVTVEAVPVIDSAPSLLLTGKPVEYALLISADISLSVTGESVEFVPFITASYSKPEIVKSGSEPFPALRAEFSDEASLADPLKIESSPELPLATIEPETGSSIQQEMPEAQAVKPETQMLDMINLLEKQLADAAYRNSYLETRLTALEDQVKFLTQAHCQNRSFNKLLIAIPALALLLAILIFRFSGQIQL